MRHFINEWVKPLLFAVLFVGAIFVVVKQCKEELEITKGERCIKHHIDLIRDCENKFYKCKFFNKPDCVFLHRQCVEPYNRCLGNF